MTTTTTTGPLEGYLQVVPVVTRDGDIADDRRAAGVYYRQLNDGDPGRVRRWREDGRLSNVNGQRYIGNGISGKGLRIEIDGVPGNDLAMFMDGPTVVTSGNAQDGVGNTMNAGTVYRARRRRRRARLRHARRPGLRAAATSATASAST